MKYTAHVLVFVLGIATCAMAAYGALQLNMVQEEIGHTLKRGGQIYVGNSPVVSVRTGYTGVASPFGRRCGNISLDKWQGFMDSLGEQKNHWMDFETFETLLKKYSYHDLTDVEQAECNKELPARYVINDGTGPRRIMYDLDRLNNEGHLVEIGSISVNSPCRTDSPLIMVPNWYIAQNENNVVGVVQCDIEK